MNISWWLTIGLSILAGLFLVRAFIIFHDCGHGSFFKSKKANDILGFITGMMTFTPYHHWKWEHAMHHATNGDLDRRGIGDIWTLTVKEYLTSSRMTYYNPSMQWFSGNIGFHHIHLNAMILQLIINRRKSQILENRFGMRKTVSPIGNGMRQAA